jgi:hypothetical protein
MRPILGIAVLVFALSWEATASSQQVRTLELKSVERAIDEFGVRTGTIVSRAAVNSLSGLTIGASDTSWVGKMLEKMPVLHITVQPEPPLDYVIRVNDDPPISPRKSPNDIVVPSGRIVVRVTRGQAHACVWGPQEVREDQIINCRLP